MPKLRVQGREQALEVALHRSILEVVLDNAIPISTSCGGVAACGLCRITVISGAELLTPANAKEISHLGSATVAAGLRLACQSRFIGEGEVEVEIPSVGMSDARKQEKFTRMIRERRAQAAANKRRPAASSGRGRATSTGERRGGATQGAAGQVHAPGLTGSSAQAPAASKGEEQPRPRRRRRRRRR